MCVCAVCKRERERERERDYICALDKLAELLLGVCVSLSMRVCRVYEREIYITQAWELSSDPLITDVF